jgi:hypothetical protein
VKITDVTVKRYSGAREPRTDLGGIQIVEVHTDVGVTGMGSSSFRQTPRASAWSWMTPWPPPPSSSDAFEHLSRL